MPALSEVFQPDPVEFKIGPGDARITVAFDRNKVNLDWLSRLRDAALAMDVQTIGDLLADVVDGWDLTNDDGTAYLPTAANIIVLPSGVLRALSDSVLELSMPASDEGKDLSGLSSTPPGISAAPSRTHRDGQGISPSLTSSASPSTP